MKAGGWIVSPKGQMVHTVAVVFGSDARTVCGIQVAPWSGWGKVTRKIEDYRQCGNCSIYGEEPGVADVG